MKKSQLITCILFAFMLFVVMITTTTLSLDRDLALFQLQMQSLPQAVGFFISAAAGLALLLKALGGATLERLAPLVLPLFAGLLLIQIHWTLSVSLGLIALAFVIRQILELFARPKKADSE